MHTSPIRFLLDGAVIEAEVAPTTTLLNFLRDTLGRTGSKEGCAEGDCGACTVAVGECSHDGSVQYRAINSCIRFVPTLDGKEVVTVESLAAPDGSLHPVQQAMVDCHASQCGFCTPGFVMSLFALYLQQPEGVERTDILDALAGNLCRCTGYRPIIDAGLCMNDYPEPARWSRSDAASPERAARLQALQRDAAVDVPGYFAPRTLAELATRYAAEPTSLLLAGGTDIGLWVTKQQRVLPPLIYLGDVAELKGLRTHDGVLDIGAAVSLTDAYPAIVALYPGFAELGNRFASPPVRNSGTLCGNLANGSPIGDSMPALIAIGASVLLRCGDAERTLPLEDLYLDYQKKALAPGEFVAGVRIPLPVPEQIRHVACYKISKRFEQDISAVCGAFGVRLENGVVSDVRIAYGGMAATPRRARHVEAALLGKPWNAANLALACAAYAEDFAPIGDMRASAAYRLEVAANLLRRFDLEYFAAAESPQAPLRVHDAMPV